MVIAVLIAPSLAELVKARMSQPKPSPDINQPKNLSQRIGGWVIEFISSPFLFPPLLIAVNIVILLFEVRRYSRVPVTIMAVLFICIRVAFITFFLVMMFVGHLISILSRGIKKTAEIQSDVVEIIEIAIKPPVN